MAQLTVTVRDDLTMADLNGAVVEVYRKPDGTMAAEIRIPAPKAA